jgi:uncharacterized membrane protein
LAFAYLSLNICLGIPFLELAAIPIPNPIEAKTSVENSSAKFIVMGKKKTKRGFHVKCFSANIAMQSDEVEIIKIKSERKQKKKLFS